jgi:hypothetical protein
MGYKVTRSFVNGESVLGPENKTPLSPLRKGILAVATGRAAVGIEHAAV